MKIEYDKIFPEDLKKYISEENLENIKAFATKERNRIDSTQPLLPNELKHKKAREFAYNSCTNENKSSLEKALIAENYALSDEKFIKTIENVTLDREYFDMYLKLLGHVKSKVLSNTTLSEKDKLYQAKAEAETKRLTGIFMLQMNLNIPEIIINKISQIMSFHPELIITRAENIIRKNKKEIMKDFEKTKELECVFYTTYKECNTTFVNFYYICDNENISSHDLLTLSNAIEKLQTAFVKNNIIISNTILTLDNYYQNYENNVEILRGKKNYIYMKNKNKIIKNDNKESRGTRKP